jgi:hypothetical protein
MIYLELDRYLSLHDVYATTHSFQRVYLSLCNVTYGRVLCSQDRILFEQLSRCVDELICAPEHCLCV